MRRTLTITLATYWSFAFSLIAISQFGALAVPGPEWWFTASGPLFAGTGAFMAALAFFWATISILMGSDHIDAGQGDVTRVAVCTGIAATAIGIAAAGLTGLSEQLLWAGVQLTALLATYLVMATERPSYHGRAAHNDNDRMAARLLAILAANDTRIGRMNRSISGRPKDYG